MQELLGKLVINAAFHPDSFFSIEYFKHSDFNEHTLKNTLCGGDVNFIKVRDPALPLPHLSLLLLKWKSQIGEECVIQGAEQD